MARSRATLEEVAAECQALGVQAHVIVADLPALSREASLDSRLMEGLGQLGDSISILVNNVGGQPSKNLPPCATMPCYSETLEYSSCEAFLLMNAAPAIAMTHLLLGGMIQRGKGYVLNVSSANGLQACPYITSYSSAKAYVLAYFACLRNELRGRRTGVHVDVVCPGPTATAGIGREGMPSAGVPDPCVFAERSLALAGTAFAEMPWPRHWWNSPSLGPRWDLFLPRAIAESRLYHAMDYSKFLG